MPICIHVSGNAGSCYDTASGLKALSDAVYENGERALQRAVGQSHQDWAGAAGDRFRDSITKMKEDAQEFSTHIEDLGKAIAAFADALTTVASRMEQARSAAEFGGLQANADWIADPDPDARDVDRLRQASAYKTAAEIAVTARGIEKTAHETLEKACSGEAAELNLKPYWIAAEASYRYVEGAVSQAHKWTEIAETRGTQLARFHDLLDEAIKKGDPFPEAVARRAVNAFTPAAGDAENAAASNARLILGTQDNKLVSAAAANASGLLPEGSLAAKIAEKFPYGGGILAAGETGWEVWNAKTPDDAAHAIAKGTASYGAGTAGFVTTLAVAEGAFGWEGGPVTAVGVGVAVAAAFGAGWVIDKIW